MKSFNEYIIEKKAAKVQPDIAMAKSLLLQSKTRFADLKVLQINEENASFRFESAYETIREILHAFMAKEDYKPYSHEAIVAYVTKIRSSWLSTG